MTDIEVKNSLAERNIILNPAVRWKYRSGGDFICIPESDYAKRIHDIIDDHPTLTTQEKETMHMYFADVIAVIVGADAEGQTTYTAYNDITFQEFDVLYSGTVLRSGRKVSGVWLLVADNTQRFKIIQIPRMFDHNNERTRIYLFGKDYTFPKNGVAPDMAAYEGKLIQE